jgi:hypothetical protein
MHPYKIDASISENHRLEFILPDDLPQGAVGAHLATVIF